MAKLTRKSYKRKKIAFAAVILGGVALVSSGFAAWLVTIVACVTLFAILLVAKGFIKKLYESLKNRTLRKEYETYRDNFRKQR